MMTFKQFLVESVVKFPGTSSYGYWIDNRGNFISVVYQGHDVVAMKRFNSTVGWEANMFAYQNGWIRVIYATNRPNEFDVQFEKPFVAREAIRALFFAVKNEIDTMTNPDAASIYIDDGRATVERTGEKPILAAINRYRN